MRYKVIPMEKFGSHLNAKVHVFTLFYDVNTLHDIALVWTGLVLSSHSQES